MPQSARPAHCPRCREHLPPTSRYCPGCGTAVDADGTLELLPTEPSALERFTQQPVDYPPTVHEVHRRVLGVRPSVLLAGLGVAAFLVAIVLFATGGWIVGIVALSIDAGLVLLFRAAIKREPDAEVARIATRTGNRAHGLLSFIALAARVWSGAAIELVRLRWRRIRLRRRLKSRLEPLGQAVYRDDRGRAGALKAQVIALEAALGEVDGRAAAVLDAAREATARERATVQPTEAFPAEPRSR